MHAMVKSKKNTLAAACLVIAAATAQSTIAADQVITNPVMVTCPDGWKYKDGKKSDSISGKDITPSLVPYLTNGHGIGIARVENGTNFGFIPCQPLATKNNKSWSLKIKNVIKMKYNPKKESFSCTVWTQLPPTWAVYVYSLDYYMAIDISDGPAAANYPITYFPWQPALGDEYRTTKILLRKIYGGTFVMGSPKSELGREADETQHSVILTGNYYIGVFEITQAQYTNVMGGANPSYYPGSLRPVEQVSWNMARGGTWPGGAPGAATFTGLLRAKTGEAFDLPTEAQWEYACRAGTTKALNNNTNLGKTSPDPNLDLLARYFDNGGLTGKHVRVGSYLPNNWGLYDMHGNALEWCLDWYEAYGGTVTNPPGASTGTDRVFRSGYWNSYTPGCRSAERYGTYPDFYSEATGFRLSAPAGQ